MPTWRELFSQNRNNEIEDRCLYLIFILKLQLCIIIYIKYITSDIYFCKYSFYDTNSIPKQTTDKLTR